MTTPATLKQFVTGDRTYAYILARDIAHVRNKLRLQQRNLDQLLDELETYERHVECTIRECEMDGNEVGAAFYENELAKLHAAG